MEEVPVAQQGYIFAREGRKGGESAAKAHRKEHAPFGVENIPFLGEAVKDADEQAAGNIHDKGAKRKRGEEEVLKKTGGEKPAHCPQETARACNQD